MAAGTVPAGTTATTVLGSSGEATGLLDHAELIERLGLDHRGLVHQEIVAADLIGGHAAALGEHGVLKGDRCALASPLGLAVLLLGAASLPVTAMGLTAVTTGHLLPWTEISPQGRGMRTRLSHPRLWILAR